MKTLETYLVDAEHKGVIDHQLRIQRGPGGEVRIYIHPDSVDGDTLDFEVQGNCLSPVFDLMAGEIGLSEVEGPALATKDDIDELRRLIGGIAKAS
jgi:hypothetical protein